MAKRLWCFGFVVACLMVGASLGFAQDRKKSEGAGDSSTKQIIGAKKGEPEKYVTEIEPGVTVYGRSNRFAAVGQATSFDSSPDGRTLVFSLGKIKFFDLMENKVTDTIGEASEHYQMVRYSPDGRYVFAGGQAHGSAMVRVYDAIDKTSVGTITTKIEPEKEAKAKKSEAKGDDETGVPLAFFSNNFYLQHMAVSADASYVALCSHDSIQVRDVESGELVHHVKKAGYVQGACFSADEKYLIYPKNYKIAVVDIETGEEQSKKDFPIVGQQGYYLGANIAQNQVVLPTNGALAIYGFGEDDRDAKIVTLPNGAYPQMAEFSDDGQMLVVSTWESQKMKVLIMKLGEKKPVADLSIVSNGQLNARFSGDNSRLFVSGNGISGVKEISLATDSELKETKHPSGPAEALSMHPDGEAFLAVTSGGEISWFDMKTGNVDRSITKSNVKSIDFNESGSDILLSTMWNLQSGVSRHSFKTGKSKKEYSLATVAKSGSVFSQIKKFMRSDAGSSVHRQQYSMDGCYSTDFEKIYAVSMAIEYQMQSSGLRSGYSQTQKSYAAFFEFDTETGKRKTGKQIDLSIFGFTNGQWPQVMTPSPLGDQFAIVGQKVEMMTVVDDDDDVPKVKEHHPQNQKLISLIDSETGEIISEFKVKGSQISKLSYSPDGRFLAANGYNSFSIFEVSSGDEVYKSPDNSFVRFGFSKDGSRIVVSSNQSKSKVEVLSTDTWKPVFSREKTQGTRSSLALSHDGQKVLIGLQDCRVECWDLSKIAREKK